MPRTSTTAAAHPLEATLGYSFHDRALLELALTHRSLAYEARGGGEEKNAPGTDNEQLEFLGDAVLGLLITEALFDHFPHSSEGELTRLRAALVSRRRMAQLGAELDLGPHLHLGASAERIGARERSSVLANAAEAVLAAMYLDAVRRVGRGSELTALRRLLRERLLAPDLDGLRQAVADPDAGGPSAALRDSKTILQERAQATHRGRLRYLDLEQSGPAHQREFVVAVHFEPDDGTPAEPLGQGSGPSKRLAQQAAAAAALERWPAFAASLAV